MQNFYELVEGLFLRYTYANTNMVAQLYGRFCGKKMLKKTLVFFLGFVTYFAY